MFKNISISALFGLFCFITTAFAETTTPVARIVLLQGSVSAANDGASRTLGRNSPLYTGDTITTGARALAQIAFNDGGMMTINAESSLRIQDFVWNGAEDGTERAFFELLSGGFRASSGKIGHEHPALYKVHTPHADVGINGTYYGLLLCSSGSCANAGGDLRNGLYGGAISGSINTTNTTGTQQHAEDTFFVVDNSAATPESVLIPPPIFHGGSTDIGDVAVADDTRRDDMQNISIPSPSVDQGGDTGGGDTGGGSQPPVDPVVTDNDAVKADLNAQPPAPNGSSLLLGYTRITDTRPNGSVARIDQTSSSTDSIALISDIPSGGYSDTLVASLNNVLLSGTTSSRTNLDSNPTYGAQWGVWNGDYLVMNADIQEIHDDHLNFIYSDQITSPTALSSLGGINSKLVMYRVINGTFPITHEGVVDDALPNIILAVDFVSQNLTEYTITVESLNGQAYFAELANVVNFADLGNPFMLVEPGIPCNVGNTQCAGFASLSFVGENANAAITSYSINEGSASPSSAFSGSALLEQVGVSSGISVAPDNTALLYSYGSVGGSGVYSPAASSFVTSQNSNTVIYLQDGNDVPVAASQIPDAQNDSFSISTFEASSFDTGAVSNVGGEPNNVNWGRWQGDIRMTFDGRRNYYFPMVFYVTSDNITPDLTLTQLGGIHVYNSVGGTSLVDSAGAVEGSATISMTADFVNQNITTYSLSGTYSGDTFELGLIGGTPVAFSNMNDNFALASTASPCMGTTACTGSASVQFIGTQAQGAITSFSIMNESNLVRSGAALLER